MSEKDVILYGANVIIDTPIDLNKSVEERYQQLSSLSNKFVDITIAIRSIINKEYDLLRYIINMGNMTSKSLEEYKIHRNKQAISKQTRIIVGTDSETIYKYAFEVIDAYNLLLSMVKSMEALDVHDKELLTEKKRERNIMYTVQFILSLLATLVFTIIFYFVVKDYNIKLTVVPITLIIFVFLYRMYTSYSDYKKAKLL